MSIDKEVSFTLECDIQYVSERRDYFDNKLDCHETFDGYCDSVPALRKKAKEEGWRYIKLGPNNMGDVCPACYTKWTTKQKVAAAKSSRHVH